MQVAFCICLPGPHDLLTPVATQPPSLVQLPFFLGQSGKALPAKLQETFRILSDSISIGTVPLKHTPFCFCIPSPQDLL